MDASTSWCSVAIVAAGRLLVEVNVWAKGSHAEKLIREVERALNAADLTISQVDLFAVGLGPGSFSGTRVGIATMKGLCISTGKPIVGVSSFTALARQISPGLGIAVPCAFARKGEVCLAAYEVSSDALTARAVLGPFHAPPEVAARRLRDAVPAKPIFLGGEGARMYAEVLLDRMGSQTYLAPAISDIPRASCIAAEALTLVARDEVHDVATLEPLYVRGPDLTGATKPPS